MARRKITDEEKERCLKRIAEHLAIEGPRNWEPLLQELGISRPTLYRWLEEVKGLAGSDQAPGLLRLAQKEIRKVVKPLEETVEEVKQHLPAVPSPNIVAAKGPAAVVHIDFMTRLEKLYQDTEMVREFAVTRDADGKEKIKNPVFFIASIKHRRDLLETALHSLQEVYDLNRMQQMFDAIVETIGKVDPELAQRVLEELRRLNNRYGITMEARIS